MQHAPSTGWAALAGAAILAAAPTALASPLFSGNSDQRAKTPTIARPETASIAGSYAKTAFGPGDLSRGLFSLPGPFSLPESRGPAGIAITPSYSPQNGLSEWLDAFGEF